MHTGTRVLESPIVKRLTWQPALTSGLSGHPWLVLVDPGAIDRNPYAALGTPLSGGAPLAFRRLEALDARDHADEPWGSNGLLVFLEDDWESLHPAMSGDLLLRGKSMPENQSILSGLRRFHPVDLATPPFQELQLHSAETFSAMRISAHSPAPTGSSTLLCEGARR